MLTATTAFSTVTGAIRAVVPDFLKILSEDEHLFMRRVAAERRENDDED